jgi:hypothetical protein
VPLSPATKVGILQSALGHKVFSAFVGTEEATSHLHFCCPVITDDKADACKSDSGNKNDDTLSPDDSLKGEEEEVNTDNPQPSASVPSPSLPSSEDQQECPDVTPFDLCHNDLAANLTWQDDAISALNDSTELL